MVAYQDVVNYSKHSSVTTYGYKHTDNDDTEQDCIACNLRRTMKTVTVKVITGNLTIVPSSVCIVAMDLIIKLRTFIGHLFLP